jgi:DNA-binding beta-propeller fold protein YncE
MLALIYFALAIFVGDFLCRRFYRFVSIAHRCAAAILVGLLVSSWFTYLAGLAFWWTSRPLVWGNLWFLVTAVAVLTWPRWKSKLVKPNDTRTNVRRSTDLYLPRPKGSGIADWLLIAGYVALASWMMFASFSSSDGSLRIANAQYSDFGPNTAIMQSFAVGHNFPTEYPHFSGDRIRYHFLFYFQAGNLEFLGLNPPWSLNLLTIVTLVAMLIVVMTLGEMLFNSRAVGRLGSLLFFFFGSLSYVPFLHKQASVRAAIQAIRQHGDYLPSIFPYRGESWGTWSQVTFLNQRHFASSIGILMLVLVFLVIRYRAVPARRAKAHLSGTHLLKNLRWFFAGRGRSGPVDIHQAETVETVRPQTVSSSEMASTDAIAPEPNPVPQPGTDTPSEGGLQPEVFAQSSKQEAVSLSPGDDASHSSERLREEAEAATSIATEAKQEPVVASESFRSSLPGFIFSGVLLGLIPMWNSAVFIAAVAVLGLLFVLCPLRLQMAALAITTGLIALPQMLFLSTGSGRAPVPRLLHWGYTLDHPTTENVLKYLGFTFGFKWLLSAIALIFASSLQRRFFLAALSLVAVAFSFQFTIEVLANQKFIHIWVIIANLFVAFALWRLWRLSLGGTTLPGKVVALGLFLLVIPGGLIDFFPIHNTGWSEVQYRNDPLIDWLKKNTTPRDIFLTDRFVTHPILMAGRRVLYGWPYYAWSAGYNASKYDRLYAELLEGKDPWKVYHLLKENGIKYVAYDNAVRHGQFVKRPNEQLYATYFPKVFEDSRYNGMVIYKVPETSPPKLSSLPEDVTNVFEGARGAGKGQLDSPIGIAVDGNGNVLVADTNNGRVEKFSPTGTFLSTIGTKGSGQGQLGLPNGIAIDRAGNIYVADAGNHRVQKLAPDGTLVAEWSPGLYGPRRIATGPDDSIYVVDQGRTRIVKFSPDGKVLTTWGSSGSGDGQFNDHTSVAVDPTTNKVYVADPRNKRIQVFDSNGKFLTKWIIPEWGQPAGFEDLAIDSKTGRLYASSVNINAVLAFDLNGTRIGSLTPKPPDKLEGPSGLALVDRKLYVLNMHGDRVSVIDL